MGLGIKGLVVTLVCLHASALMALNTPLSNCPRSLLAKRFTADLDAHPGWTDGQLVRKFHDYQVEELRALVPSLVSRMEDLKEAMQQEFIPTEHRAQLAGELKSLNDVHRVASEYQVSAFQVADDLDFFQEGSIGAIFSHLIKFTAHGLLDELDIKLALPEQARAMMTAIVRKVRTPEVANYVPATRDTEPTGELLRRIEGMLKGISGKAPTAHLIQTLWNRPLVRSDFYGQEWGRLEIYWELVQHNQLMDVQQESDRNRLKLYVDKLEELLLRAKPPAPTADNQ